MRIESPQWIDVGQPASAAEAEALQSIKAMLPDGALVWAWSNLSFIAVNGRLAEVDLVLLNRFGLTLIELKGWHGRITGDQRTWRVGDDPRHNPLFATNLKAKWLKGLLEYVQSGTRKVHIPYVKAITVLHGRDSVVALDSVAATDTYGLDGYNVRNVPLLSEFLARVPTDIRDAVDAKRARELVRVIGEAGFSAPPRTRKVGHYDVDRLQPVEQGTTWSDVIAEHPLLVGQRKRIRLYDVPLRSSTEHRQQILRSAQREYYLTSGLKHPGVVAPEDFFDDPQSGPALVFANDQQAMRLDRWLAEEQGALNVDQRVEVIRQLAEILKYAHGRGVTHRALTPHQVFVTATLGVPLRVSVRDWQTGRQEPGLETSTSSPSPTFMEGTRNITQAADTATWVYLAPEINAPVEPDAVALDIYGLGAVGYLILTDLPPANNIAELEQRLRESDGLDPLVALDGIPDGLRRLITRATHPDARMDRTPDVEAFLADLDEAAKELRDDAPVNSQIDPLESELSDMLGDRFMVEERLGSGSTGLALLVTDDVDRSNQSTVLKVAHDATKEPRLTAEYDTLARLDHPRINRALEPPLHLAGRLTLHLEDAGRPTLGSRIRQEGRLTLDQLERFGADLLEAAAYLDSQGVLHRDIKPDNLGVRPDPSDRRPRLVLFDFSLSAEPLEHTKAGTPPYLDPFLGAARRPRYDRAAERFAISVTLFDMATGTKPLWGSGDADPATIPDEVTVVADMFEPTVATAMMSFFTKALARDASQRHGDLSELAQAWLAVFTATDLPITQTPDQEPIGLIEDVTPTTPLDEAGLSARAISALGRLNLTTVGELLATSPFTINSIRGMGDKTRREIQRAIRTWRRAMPAHVSEPIDVTRIDADIIRSIDAVAQALLPATTTRNHAQVHTAQIMLGLVDEVDQPWPTLSQIAAVIGVTPARVSQILDRLRKPWHIVIDRQELDKELSAIMAAFGGVGEVTEVARALLATRGSAAIEPARTRQALGVIRTIIESDTARGGDSKFQARRLGERIVIALEPLDPDAPVADDTIDWVRQLADAADRLAAQRPIPGRAAALDVLTSIPAPEGRVPLTDDRLLQISTHASGTAALGSRGEVYTRGLEAEEAIRLTLAGISASSVTLTPQSLQERVTSRFPAAQPVPPRPQLDAVLLDIDPSLTWTGTQYGSTEQSRSLLSTQHGVTVFGNRIIGPAFDQVDARLTASLNTNGYLTLAVDPRRLDQATRVLTTRYPVQVVNISEVLLTAARNLAQEKGIDWSFLLNVDAANPTSPDRSSLNAFISDALDTALPSILARPEPMLLVDAAPLGRYQQHRWLVDLANLTTNRPAARWLLVPHRDSTASPTLDDNVPVPTGADGFLVVSTEFLDRIEHQESAS